MLASIIFNEISPAAEVKVPFTLVGFIFDKSFHEAQVSSIFCLFQILSFESQANWLTTLVFVNTINVPERLLGELLVDSS